MKIIKNIYPELEFIDKLIFRPCGLNFSNLEIELESQIYSACSFMLNKQNVKFRVAKITPTKIGQFVTIWKRNEKGITQPFDILDDIDLFVIATRQENHFGLFVFPKSVLHDNKVLSGKTRDGKRGIRVYPSCYLTTNKQADKTQHWQSKYFLQVTQGKSIDLKKAKLLFNIDN